MTNQGPASRGARGHVGPRDGLSRASPSSRTTRGSCCPLPVPLEEACASGRLHTAAVAAAACVLLVAGEFVTNGAAMGGNPGVEGADDTSTRLSAGTSPSAARKVGCVGVLARAKPRRARGWRPPLRSSGLPGGEGAAGCDGAWLSGESNWGPRSRTATSSMRVSGGEPLGGRSSHSGRGRAPSTLARRWPAVLGERGSCRPEPPGRLGVRVSREGTLPSEERPDTCCRRCAACCRAWSSGLAAAMCTVPFVDARRHAS